MGVHVHENCAVKKVLLNEESQVYAVDTDEGFLAPKKKQKLQ